MKRKPDYDGAAENILISLAHMTAGLESASRGLPVTATGFTVGAFGCAYEAYNNLSEGCDYGEGFRASELGCYAGAAECAWRGMSENNPGYFLVAGFILCMGFTLPRRLRRDAEEYHKNSEREEQPKSLTQGKK